MSWDVVNAFPFFITQICCGIGRRPDEIVAVMSVSPQLLLGFHKKQAETAIDLFCAPH
jgi:hypothetical protein